jgi:hypothetical protein
VLKARKKEQFSVLLPKYVMSAAAYKIVLSCVTLRSITEVMKIILLHLYSFKIPLIKF